MNVTAPVPSPIPFNNSGTYKSSTPAMNWDTELTYSNLFPNPGLNVRPEHAYVPPHDR